MESREGILIIGICDDDKSWVQTCKNTLMKFAAFINIDMEIKCFYTSKELLDYQDIPLDAVFLDIELGRQNGIMIAKKLNRIRPNCHIWFVVKKQFRDKIGEIINRILHDLENKTVHLVLKTVNNEIISVIPSDICYLEREKRGTRVVTVWDEYHVKERFVEIIPQLSELDFSQCHSSYVVNFRHVKELQRDMYILYDESETVQISRRFVQKTREDFLKWSALFV